MLVRGDARRAAEGTGDDVTLGVRGQRPAWEGGAGPGDRKMVPTIITVMKKNYLTAGCRGGRQHG